MRLVVVFNAARARARDYDGAIEGGNPIAIFTTIRARSR